MESEYDMNNLIWQLYFLFLTDGNGSLVYTNIVYHVQCTFVFGVASIGSNFSKANGTAACTVVDVS